MKIFSPIKTTLALVMLAVAFSSSIHAQDAGSPPTCEGNWHIELNTSSSTEEQKGLRGVWIPGTVYLDRTLAKCTKEIVLKQPQGGPPLLHGQNSSHGYELKNTSRQVLPTMNRNDYVLPVFGKQKIDLWVYIPGGRDLSPGQYRGTLDVELSNISNPELLQQTYSFNYQVKPYVRVKIANSGNSWIHPSGTSIRIDLGDLTKKNLRDLPVVIESNGFVSMSVSSFNKGNLVNVTNKQNKVPYQLQLGGQQVNLTDEMILDTGNRPFVSQKMIASFQNTAKPFARAGQYEDVVTISLYAR